MAARGHIPFEGRSIQAPGMMRHGPYPGALVPAGPHQPLEPLPPPELLEHKIIVQAAEAERILRENQRLAATHVALREELIATQQERQRIQAHVGSIQTESDIQVRGLLEKIKKMEGDIRNGEIVKKELQQAHLEAQGLYLARQELTAEIQLVTEELQKSNVDGKRLPELNMELDELRQEHQKLRAAFEHEKGSNVEQVEQMRSMEKNLISLAREVEKLRAEVMNAERGMHAPNSYSGSGTYGSPDPSYPPVAVGGGYAGGGYGHGHSYGSEYPNARYVHGGPASYPQPYERSQAQRTPPAAGGPSYSDGYGRPQPQMSGGAAAPMEAGYADGYGRHHAQMAGAGALGGESTNNYGGFAGADSYDAPVGGSMS